MSTREWGVGYDEGYQQGWDDAMDQKPAEANEPVAYIEHHKAGDNLVWDNPGANSSPLYTTPPQPMHPEIKKMYEDYFDKCFRESSPTQQEPVAWKLVPIKPTNEMLKAMDECSTEGYDERLYAGHAASVYMAAVDVAPSPPQRKEPEPVVWMYVNRSTHETIFQRHMRSFVDHGNWTETPLYSEPLANHELNCVCGAVWCGDEMVHLPHKSTPPQRKPLTDEQMWEVWNEQGDDAMEQKAAIAFARAIEAAHGIKENT